MKICMIGDTLEESPPWVEAPCSAGREGDGTDEAVKIQVSTLLQGLFLLRALSAGAFGYIDPSPSTLTVHLSVFAS